LLKIIVSNVINLKLKRFIGLKKLCKTFRMKKLI